jgi:hypothetical protein
MWGALSDERTGLSFTIAAGHCQRSHFRVRVPWYSRPYFTVSDLRLPFSSPPTNCRATVEVFDPDSIREYMCTRSQSHIATDCQSISTPSGLVLYSRGRDNIENMCHLTNREFIGPLQAPGLARTTYKTQPPLLLHNLATDCLSISCLRVN